jgi:hypothetical protein
MLHHAFKTIAEQGQMVNVAMLAWDLLSVNSRQRRRRVTRSKSELAIPERATAAASSLQGRVRANNKRGGGGGKAALTAKVALTRVA